MGRWAENQEDYYVGCDHAGCEERYCMILAVDEEENARKAKEAGWLIPEDVDGKHLCPKHKEEQIAAGGVELKVDPDRMKFKELTGIFVRAKNGDSWGSYDCAVLDKPSFLSWIRSRGGSNAFAEDILGLVMGYGRFSDTE